MSRKSTGPQADGLIIQVLMSDISTMKNSNIDRPATGQNTILRSPESLALWPANHCITTGCCEAIEIPFND